MTPVFYSAVINGYISVTADLSVTVFPYLMSVTMMPGLLQHHDDNSIRITIYENVQYCSKALMIKAHHARYLLFRAGVFY